MVGLKRARYNSSKALVDVIYILGLDESQVYFPLVQLLHTNHVSSSTLRGPTGFYIVKFVNNLVLTCPNLLCHKYNSKEFILADKHVFVSTISLCYN